MSEEYLKVEGHEHLVRDMNSKAIINTSEVHMKSSLLYGQGMYKNKKMN